MVQVPYQLLTSLLCRCSPGTLSLNDIDLLSASIPSSISQLTGLEYFSMARCHSGSGPLPVEIGNLTNLGMMNAFHFI